MTETSPTREYHVSLIMDGEEVSERLPVLVTITATDDSARAAYVDREISIEAPRSGTATLRFHLETTGPDWAWEWTFPREVRETDRVIMGPTR